MKNNFYRTGDKILEIRHEEIDGKNVNYMLYEYENTGELKAKIEFKDEQDDRKILNALSVLTKEPFCSDHDIEYAKNRDNFRKPFAELAAAANG